MRKKKLYYWVLDREADYKLYPEEFSRYDVAYGDGSIKDLIRTIEVYNNQELKSRRKSKLQYFIANEIPSHMINDHMDHLYIKIYMKSIYT